MSRPHHTERRDPCAPVMKLGTMLTQARHGHMNGAISLEAGPDSHRIIISKGIIREVKGPGGTLDARQAPAVFELQRPLITFAEESVNPVGHHALDPVHLLIAGLSHRHDLFNPATFKERVPLASLNIEYGQLLELRRLPFTPEENAFFERLLHPAPISMILWKRGLSPSHAASLVATLNLLGVWKNSWAPGYLPRVHPATHVLKMVQTNADDYQLLGLPPEAPAEEIDKAFRQLSFVLHPDRNQSQPESIQRHCQEAFTAISGAYQRLKLHRTTRRKRPVMNRAADTATPNTGMWQGVLAAAEKALEQGNVQLARKYAINGLLLNPPELVRHRFRTLLCMAA